MSQWSRNKIVYVFDVLCPWCYAFTPVVRQLREYYGGRFDFEALSGGMVRGDEVQVVGGEEEAERRRTGYRRIEEMTDVRFGEAFFERLATGERRMDSEPPSIALAAFRSLATGRSELDFAHASLRGVFYDGGDPNEAEFYRSIAEELQIDADRLLVEMERPESRDRALYEFAVVRQLGADSFPRLYFQTAEDYLHLVAKGYSDFERLRKTIDTIEAEE